MRQESDLQGREARRVSKPVPSPIGLRIQVFGSGRSGARTHKALAGSAVFETAAVVQHSACPSKRSPSGWRADRTPARLVTVAAAFQAGPLPLGQPSIELERFRTGTGNAAESGLLESHALRHASASNGARRACPVHSPRSLEPRTQAEYRPRDSNPDLHGLSVVPLPIGLGRHDPPSPRLASNQLPSAYEADALPDELQGHSAANHTSCRSKIRTCTYVSQSHASCRLDDPASSTRPAAGRVQYGRRDLNSHELTLTRV